jgi:hypothetical protein
MIRTILLVTTLISAPATAQQIVTSPVRLIDNSPKTLGIIIANAKTTPSLNPPPLFPGSLGCEKETGACGFLTFAESLEDWQYPCLQ